MRLMSCVTMPVNLQLVSEGISFRGLLQVVTTSLEIHLSFAQEPEGCHFRAK